MIVSYFGTTPQDLYTFSIFDLNCVVILKESPWNDSSVDTPKRRNVDPSLVQLLDNDEERENPLQYLHPNILKSATSDVCHIGPLPLGVSSASGMFSSQSIVHRTQEEIATLAQNKHERALVSQVVSPQDIEVSYDISVKVLPTL